MYSPMVSGRYRLLWLFSFWKSHVLFTRRRFFSNTVYARLNYLHSTTHEWGKKIGGLFGLRNQPRSRYTHFSSLFLSSNIVPFTIYLCILFSFSLLKCYTHILQKRATAVGSEGGLEGITRTVNPALWLSIVHWKTKFEM